MRIIDTSLGKDREYDSVQSAVGDSLQPSAYSYNNDTEKLKLQVEKLQEMVAKLVAVIYDPMEFQKSDVDQLADILGYGYEVEE